MTDPRNIQHDKKVKHDKEHHGEAQVENTEHVPQPGKKPHLVHPAGEASHEKEDVNGPAAE